MATASKGNREDWNKGNIVNKGKINLLSDLGLHGLVFEAPNKHAKRRRWKRHRQHVSHAERHQMSNRAYTAVRNASSAHPPSSPDEISYDFCKHGGGSIIEMLKCLFDMRWSEKIPDEWNKCNVLLHEGRHKSMQELDYRPIALAD
ncbi:hypothetical protein FHG87_012185 [Trinorchestia longiramus]|nr:hypothetical protein FHG87_012185 [Trinorchestia longiramus]